MSQAPNQGKLLTTGIGLFFVVIVVLLLSNATFLTIEPGKAGVLFKRFSGLDRENVYQPGFHVIAPWNQMYIYEVREQIISETMEVLSSNGLNINVDVTVRFNPVTSQIGEIHNTFSQEYQDRLVRPEIRSSVREVVGRYTPEELYSTKRDEVQTAIHEDLQQTLEENYVNLRAILIRDISLPEKVVNAIETKLEEEQKAQQLVFRLDRARKEAEQRIIEAEAKAEANRILNASLSPNILRDKGIEATLELAKSGNSKVVIVGSGDDGLPLILGN